MSRKSKVSRKKSDANHVGRARMTDEIVGKMKNGSEGFGTTVTLATAERDGRKPMKVKWVYVVKYNLDGSIKAFKSRIVACGYAQKEGIDFNETFAGTIRATTVRMFFAVVAQLDLDLGLVDALKAFTQSEIDCLLYCEMLKGFEIPGHCIRLNMALEGTKQAAHLWQTMLSNAFEKLGFTRSLIDPSLYVKRENEGIIIAICWVDDIAVGYSNQQMYDEFCAGMEKEIKCTFDRLEVFVGLQITRDRAARTLTLTQTKYITKLFERHLSVGSHKGWKDSTPVGTSVTEIKKFMGLVPTENEQERITNIKRGYMSILGGVMFAMVFTRPDIAFHTSRLASSMSSPSNESYEHLLGVVRYLYNTKHLGLTYGKMRDDGDEQTEENMLYVWGDGSFNGVGETSPYGGGYVEYYFGTVSYVSRMLKFKPLSSAEQEVAAMMVMLKEGMFVMRVGEDMGVKLKSVPQLMTDSKSGRDIVVNPGVTKHTVHFERWLHYVREAYLRKKINIVFVPTDKMRADDKTKVVYKSKFEYCRKFQLNLSEKI